MGLIDVVVLSLLIGYLINGTGYACAWQSNAKL